MIIKYSKSLFGGKPIDHNFINTFLLFTGAVFAGYLATQLPEDFLKNFEKPFFQFIIFLILGASVYDIKKMYMFIILDALIFTVIFQMFVKIINNIYHNENKSKI